MRLPIPTPEGVRNFVVDGVDVSRRVVTMVVRADALLDTAEQLLDRVTALVVRIERTDAAARQVVEQVDNTHRQVRELVEVRGAASARVIAALDAYVPALYAIHPAAERLATSWTPQDIDGLTAALQASPGVATALENRVIPVLETFQSIGPDLRELLTTSRALNEIIGAVPGLGRAKKKADEQLEQEDAGPAVAPA